MSAKKKDDRPAAGDSKRKPTEVKLYQMPENLDEMSDEEIHELARRIYKSFTAAVRPEE
jgi:hypothetical protein